MLFSTSIFDRFWSQLGPNLAPKSTPKPIQEPSKIDPKSHLIFDLFFDRFFIDFRCQNEPKIYQKSTPKSSQEHINKKLKTSILYCNLQYIRALGYVMLCTKLKKNDTEILSKIALKSTPNLDRFCTQLGSILGGFWSPRWNQIPSNRFKNQPSNRSSNG